MSISQNEYGIYRCEVHHSVTALCLHVDTICRRDDLWMESRAICEQTLVRISLELLKICCIVGARHFGVTQAL